MLFISCEVNENVFVIVFPLSHAQNSFNFSRFFLVSRWKNKKWILDIKAQRKVERVTRKFSLSCRHSHAQIGRTNDVTFVFHHVFPWRHNWMTTLVWQRNHARMNRKTFPHMFWVFVSVFSGSFPLAAAQNKHRNGTHRRHLKVS